MPGHFVVFRHMDGDAWDYCVIEHLGTKATVEASRPAPPATQTALGDWHTDTFAAGPSWTEFAKQMGLDDAAKSTASTYAVSIYRPVTGQREALDKFLNEPPDRTVDTTSGNVVLQHAGRRSLDVRRDRALQLMGGLCEEPDEQRGPDEQETGRLVQIAQSRVVPYRHALRPDRPLVFGYCEPLLSCRPVLRSAGTV